MALGSGVKSALAVGAALGLLGGIAYAASSSPAPAPTPAPTPTPTPTGGGGGGGGAAGGGTGGTNQQGGGIGKTVTTGATGGPFNMVSGQRYRVTVQSATSIVVPTPVKANAWLDAVRPGIYKVASVSSSTNFPNAYSYEVDVIGATQPQEAADVLDVSRTFAAAITVTILGATPLSVWTLADTVNPGDQVRISMTQDSYNVVTQSIGHAALPGQGWASLLSNPIVASVLAPFGGVQTWNPGDALPADWPSDDSGAQEEYHAQFTYGGSSPLPVSKMPIPVKLWTLSPAKLAGGPSPGGGIVKQGTP